MSETVPTPWGNIFMTTSQKWTKKINRYPLILAWTITYFQTTYRKLQLSLVLKAIFQERKGNGITFPNLALHLRRGLALREASCLNCRETCYPASFKWLFMFYYFCPYSIFQFCYGFPIFFKYMLFTLASLRNTSPQDIFVWRFKKRTLLPLSTRFLRGKTIARSFLPSPWRSALLFFFHFSPFGISCRTYPPPPTCASYSGRAGPIIAILRFYAPSLTFTNSSVAMVACLVVCASLVTLFPVRLCSSRTFLLHTGVGVKECLYLTFWILLYTSCCRIRCGCCCVPPLSFFFPLFHTYFFHPTGQKVNFVADFLRAVFDVFINSDIARCVRLSFARILLPTFPCVCAPQSPSCYRRVREWKRICTVLSGFFSIYSVVIVVSFISSSVLPSFTCIFSSRWRHVSFLSFALFLLFISFSRFPR